MEDKFLRFLGLHSPKIVSVIIVFQTIMFFKYIWLHKIWEFGFLGLCVSVESLMWSWMSNLK